MGIGEDNSGGRATAILTLTGRGDPQKISDGQSVEAFRSSATLAGDSIAVQKLCELSAGDVKAAERSRVSAGQPLHEWLAVLAKPPDRIADKR